MKNYFSNAKLRIWFKHNILERLLKWTGGQVLAIFALTLPVIFGGGAIAVDLGHLFVARNTMQNAADAGARAGATILATGGTQGAATAEAVIFAARNLAFPAYFTGATPVVTFPTAQTIQVTINHNLPLYLAPIIGLTSAAVTTNAQAQFTPAVASPPFFMAPYSIACNRPNGCQGQLAVGQTLTLRRYCGNFYMDGPDGNACGSSIKNNETFTLGITFTSSVNMSNEEFRTHVRDGYDQTVSIGNLAQALPGQRNGWRDGMFDRLLAGGHEVVLPVIKEASNPVGDYNIEIADLIMVRISNFQLLGKSDGLTFEIIEGSIPATGFPTNPQNLGINSVSIVQLVQ